MKLIVTRTIAVVAVTSLLLSVATSTRGPAIPRPD